MLFELLIFIVSLAALSQSSKVAVDKALHLSKFLRISEMAAGFLILSLATTLPEFSVSAIASYENQPSLAMGNAIGSTIANILLIAGIAAFVGGGLALKPIEKKKSVQLLFGAALVLIFLASGLPPQIAGMILLLLFISFVYFTFIGNRIRKEVSESISKKEALFSFLIFALSMLFVFGSSKLVVDSSISLATFFGLSKTFLGATIIAAGTSLPELAVSLSAIRRKRSDVALGNILGANFTDLTLVLGVAILLNPLSASLLSVPLLFVFALLSNAVLFIFLQKEKIGKPQGAVLLLIYALFVLLMGASPKI